MINLVILSLDKKLLTSRFLTASPVHSAEFEEILALTCSPFAQRSIKTSRLWRPSSNFVDKIMLALTMFS